MHFLYCRYDRYESKTLSVHVFLLAHSSSTRIVKFSMLKIIKEMINYQRMIINSANHKDVEYVPLLKINKVKSEIE